jgi:hypothetical protein
MPAILKWSEIKDDFHEGLVLGNGASIALDKRFAYQSLLKHAKRNKLIKNNEQAIFDHLHTKDFERVLRMLWHTNRINKALKVKDTKTRQAYGRVRSALVDTVTAIHPDYSKVCERLVAAVNFLKRFETVASLNYDLLVYWAIILGNKRHRNRLKDCFVHGHFHSDWETLREPYGSARRSTLIFYPHGNLALATDIEGRETKQAATTFSTLLRTIISEWKSESQTPLFVSEGTSRQKLAAISRSHYLKTVYDSVLPKLGKRVAVFGWSMDKSDKHILEAICRGDLNDVAVSVFTSVANLRDKCAHIERKIRDASSKHNVRVVFFDAESRGCWVNI